MRDSKYFRYVDDIVVVAPPGELQSRQAQIESILADEGLALNSDKTDVLSANEWLDHGPAAHTRVQADSFESLVFKIKVYLARQPDRLHELEARLSEQEFAIPLGRLVAESRAHGFQSRLLSLLRAGWDVARRARSAGMNEILDSALAARTKLIDSIARQLGHEIPQGATRRKWHLQKTRYLVNRAVYLLPHADLDAIAAALESIPELRENVALLRVLAGNELDDLLLFPGPAIAAAAGALSQSSRLASCTYSEVTDRRAWIESIETLAMFGVLEEPRAATPPEPTATEQTWINFATGAPTPARVSPDFNYEDEIQALHVGKSAADAKHALESRYSEDEITVFDALEIGDGYAS